MSETAIQKDVVEEPKTTDIEIEKTNEIDIDKKSPRESVMDNIYKKRREVLDREIEDEAFKPKTEEKVEIDLEPAPEPKVAKAVKIKVNGVESEVTEKEIQEYQKQKAADVRLDELSRERAAFEKEKEETRKRLEQEKADREKFLAAEALKIAQAADDVDDAEELAEKLISSVFEEDKKSAAEIIRKLKSKRDVTAIPAAAPAIQKIDSSEISRAVESALDMKERQKASKRFDVEYKELASKKALRAEVNERTIIEMQADPGASYWEVIDRAAKFVKADLAKTLGMEEVKKVDDDPLKTEFDRRAANKKELGSTVKTAATVKASLETGPAKPKLTVIQQMKKDRGQPYL